jgi:hypothetical protein
MQYLARPLYLVVPRTINLTQDGSEITLGYPGDLDTRKWTGTSYQIEIHFTIKTTEYLP